MVTISTYRLGCSFHANSHGGQTEGVLVFVRLTNVFSNLAGSAPLSQGPELNFWLQVESNLPLAMAPVWPECSNWVHC